MTEKEQAILFDKILSYMLHMNCFTHVLDGIKEQKLLYKQRIKRDLNSLMNEVEKVLDSEFKEFHDIADVDLVQQYYNQTIDFFDNISKLSVSQRLSLFESVNKQLNGRNKEDISVE